MGTFFKTFFVCLLLTFSFLMYKYFSVDGYSHDLSVSKNNPIFGVHKEAQPIEYPHQPKQEENVPAEIKQNKNENIVSKENNNSEKLVKQKKYTHKCYFYSKNGALTLIQRELSAQPSIDKSILVLLKGPTIPETKKGIYSEIPANVDLIGVKKDENSVIVDLTSNFGNGGGTRSVENRVKQLSKTIKLHEPNKKIYLFINGKEVEYLGGDGVYIKQPLD